MTSFLRSVVSVRGREVVIKESLTSQLSSSVKEIQLQQSQLDEKEAEQLANNDATQSLCTVLEAIFIHGLKDTFLNTVSQAIGGDPDQPPEPNFWGPLLIFSHREIIDQINALSLVTTDVGRCRAWLRLALNDGLLSRYLEAMRRDGSALKPYYRRSAFLRDVELLDVAQRLIEGIETCQYCLVCNSSLLNIWTNQPLLLAGLWTPPLRACPVMSGVDVASMMEDNVPTRESSPAISMSCPRKDEGIGQVLPMSEDEALRIILGTPVTETLTPQNIQKNCSEMNGGDDGSEKNGNVRPTPGTDIPSRQCMTAKGNGDDEDGHSSVGNSLIGRVGWSSSFEEFPDAEERNGIEGPEHLDRITSKNFRGNSSSVVSQSRSTGLRSPSDVPSYHAVVESYNNLSGGYMKTPDLRDFCHRFESTTESAMDTGVEADDLLSSLYGMGFEVIPTSPTSLFEIPEFASMVQQMGKLATEPGLDMQNYTCKSCGHPVGMNFGKARVCSFVGGYFCPECHVGDEWIIPARVIHNWDFRRYPVAKKSAAFLDEIQHHPLLDLKILNPRLYLAVEEMAQLQDLLQIPSGGLAQLLQRVVSFARGHILGCWLCSQKGFICEICNSPKVIYPFDTESTYRCSVCCAVFHVGCLDASKPCPKCERRQKREDLPLLEAVDS
ncbi:uncharacterized protein Plekhm1 isoform X2 [Anabrus simplex]|uniref:uncharacterized protein Plekhm1 isoform X2 n=1 Tax=Anabrus simplex TaxID=316456 RepID=UPI0035A36D25